MAIKNLNPYLNFNGDAAKAIALYETVFGTKAEQVGRFGEVPGGDVPPEHADRIMHARLSIGPGMVMLSDAPPGMAVAKESNTHVCLDFDDASDMTKKFDALADGGRVTMPLQDTFWGATFGMLTDRHGIRWMFNCDKKS
jgi:PhnB protein